MCWYKYRLCVISCSSTTTWAQRTKYNKRKRKYWWIKKHTKRKNTQNIMYVSYSENFFEIRIVFKWKKKNIKYMYLRAAVVVVVHIYTYMQSSSLYISWTYSSFFSFFVNSLLDHHKFISFLLLKQRRSKRSWKKKLTKSINTLKNMINEKEKQQFFVCMLIDGIFFSIVNGCTTRWISLSK